MSSLERGEVWSFVPTAVRGSAERARQAEEEGFDGVMLADSQNLAAELIVELSMCAGATERIGLSPGVANPVTRHPALLAGAMATLQAETGGRVELGIGRGDSALAYIGCAPVGVGHFEKYLRALRAYLHGEEVPFDRSFVPAGVREIETLDLATGPTVSGLSWLDGGQPPVPVMVAASGPRVIELAATLADGLTLAVGADPSRVAWAIECAHDARRRAGLDPSGLRIAAWINVAVHSDRDTARELVGGFLASFSRFSALHGAPVVGARPADSDVLQSVSDSYDMTNHGRQGADHATVLTDDFKDRNAIIGDPDTCIDRFRELRELGVSRFITVETRAEGSEAPVAHRNLVEHVLPALDPMITEGGSNDHNHR